LNWEPIGIISVGSFYFKKMAITYDKSSVRSGVVSTDVLSLADAKLFLRVDSDAEDSLITDLIKVAVEHVQNHTGQLLDEVDDVVIWAEDWETLQIPIAPITSIKSIQYYDESNTLQTLASNLYWMQEGESVSPQIRFDLPLPDLYDERTHRIKIIADVGFAVIPSELKHAVRLMMSQYYDVRENFAVGTTVSAEMPNGVKALMNQWRNIYFQ
jgi:uncharacterized phiE125 gp8 family phage protein